MKLENIIKLASNENPLGVGIKSRSAIRRALGQINRYPEGSCYYLRRALSRKLRIKPDMLLFGNGSDELIDIIIKTFVEPDENIITADITFLEYQIIAQILAREVRKVKLRDFRYDLPAILERINDKTKVVFIANPNNPTGTYVNSRQLDEFINRVPEDVIIVLDEAYDVFVNAPDFPRSLEYIGRKKNLIILKTFSKAYGLAGLRIGYALACPELISYMDRVRPPFNVNMLAQAAALAALQDKSYIQKTRRIISEGRVYLKDQLNKLGLPIVPSVANFLLIDVGSNGKLLCEEMLKFGMIVRDMQQYGLENFIRVTVGTPAENKRFIEVIKKVL